MAIKVKVKVKFEDKTYSDTIHLPEEYIFSKQNPDFISLIKNICTASTFEKPDEVTANIFMEL